MSCRTWVLWKVVTHPKMKEPVIESVHLNGTLDQVIKNIKLSGPNLYRLKKDRRLEYVDKKGGTTVLELTEGDPQ